MEEVAQVLQSNDTSMTDDELEFIVTVARNRNGGARLKLGNIFYDDILSKKGRFLYNPKNNGNNLCFSLCLAHFANPNMSESEKHEYAARLHASVGFDQLYKISL